jgi:monofunctional biosynthetic peptidoglycan transglycosylase
MATRFFSFAGRLWRPRAGRAGGTRARRGGGGRRILWTMAVVFLAPHMLLLIYRFVPPPITPLMVQRLFEGESLHKDWVPLSDIAVTLPRSVIAGEDNRFCIHDGVDWEELDEVIAQYRAGKHTRGASTLTMQTVKNLILWQGRDVLRKGLEIYFALYLDLIWPKTRIMEVYLNIVEWGHGLYGAEAASKHYFGRPADRLTPVQASLLASVLPNPREWSAGQPGPYVRERSGIIRGRVEQLGSYLDCVNR